jgi:hypothetical protein
MSFDMRHIAHICGKVMSSREARAALERDRIFLQQGFSFNEET